MSNSPDEKNQPEDSAAANGGWSLPGGEAPGMPPPGYGPPPVQPPPGYYPQPGYAPPPGYYPPHQRTGLSFGVQLAIGIGIGLGLGVITFIFVLSAAFTHPVLATVAALTIPLAAVVALFFQATRGYATGILIMLAASWVTAIGPCLAIFLI